MVLVIPRHLAGVEEVVVARLMVVLADLLRMAEAVLAVVLVRALAVLQVWVGQGLSC